MVDKLPIIYKRTHRYRYPGYTLYGTRERSTNEDFLSTPARNHCNLQQELSVILSEYVVLLVYVGILGVYYYIKLGSYA